MKGIKKIETRAACKTDIKLVFIHPYSIPALSGLQCVRNTQSASTLSAPAVSVLHHLEFTLGTSLYRDTSSYWTGVADTVVWGIFRGPRVYNESKIRQKSVFFLTVDDADPHNYLGPSCRILIPVLAATDFSIQLRSVTGSLILVPSYTTQCERCS